MQAGKWIFNLTHISHRPELEQSLILRVSLRVILLHCTHRTAGEKKDIVLFFQSLGGIIGRPYLGLRKCKQSSRLIFAKVSKSVLASGDYLFYPRRPTSTKYLNPQNLYQPTSTRAATAKKPPRQSL